MSKRCSFSSYLEAHGKYGNHRVVAMAKLGLALYYEVQSQAPTKLLPGPTKPF
jgi:hypothetical protein